MKQRHTRRHRRRTRTKRQKGGNDDQCPICFNEYDDQVHARTMVDANGHVVCGECLPGVLALGRGCPICRGPFLPQFQIAADGRRRLEMLREEDRYEELVQMCETLLTDIDRIIRDRQSSSLELYGIYGDVERIYTHLREYPASRHVGAYTAEVCEPIHEHLVNYIRQVEWLSRE